MFFLKNHYMVASIHNSFIMPLQSQNLSRIFPADSTVLSDGYLCLLFLVLFTICKVYFMHYEPPCGPSFTGQQNYTAIWTTIQCLCDTDLEQAVFVGSTVRRVHNSRRNYKWQSAVFKAVGGWWQREGGDALYRLSVGRSLHSTWSPCPVYNSVLDCVSHASCLHPWKLR